MRTTNLIYEEPSRLSQGLVVGLSIAVVLMAGWLAATILFSDAATTSAEGDAYVTESRPVVDGMAHAPDVRQMARSNSVHFDWPEEFASSAPPPQRSTLPLASELPAIPDPGRSPWPAEVAGPEAADRGLALRQPAGAATEAADAIVDILAPQRHGTAAAVATPPRPAPPRRRKPRVETDAGQ